MQSAVTPAEVAEPYRAARIDGDAETAAENAATRQGRPRRAVPAIGRLAIGFKYQVEHTGVWCALDRVVRDPSVSSSSNARFPGPLIRRSGSSLPESLILTVTVQASGMVTSGGAYKLLSNVKS